MFQEIQGEEETTDCKVTFAPLKGRVRAQEKADDDYGKRTPGPAECLLYDIVRGSVEFSTAEKLIQCLEWLQNDPTIHIVKAKNRFQTPTLTGYRDLNLHIRIPGEHICELQIHHHAIRQLNIELKSHDFY